MKNIPFLFACLARTNSVLMVIASAGFLFLAVQTSSAKVLDCAKSMTEILEGTPFLNRSMVVPPDTSDLLNDIGVTRVTNPFAAKAFLAKQKSGASTKDLPRVKIDLKTNAGLVNLKNIVAEFRRLMNQQELQKQQAKEANSVSPKVLFRVGGKIGVIVENMEKVISALELIDANPPSIDGEEELVEYRAQRKFLLYSLDFLATGLSRNYMSPIPLDRTLYGILKLGVMNKLGLLVPGIKPLPKTLWGVQGDQASNSLPSWQQDPINGLAWSSANEAGKSENLYVAPAPSDKLSINASDVSPKTGYGAHWGGTGEVKATYVDVTTGKSKELTIGNIKFRLGDDDTSRIEHRGESKTGPIGTGFARALGYNSADIRYLGDLKIKNDKTGSIREIFKTANIRREFGWSLRWWANGPVIPFTEKLTQNRQKYYNPFQVVTEVGLKDGSVITDYREFQKRYFKGDVSLLAKRHKGEQEDANYDLNFESQITYIKVGPVSAEALVPKTKKKLEKQKKYERKLEMNGNEVIEFLKSNRAQTNLSSLDTNNNLYHSHKAIRGLTPLIAMLQAWDIRPENLRVTIHIYEDGTQKLMIRFSDWGSILGLAKGFTGNSNADPNNYPIEVIKSIDKDKKGNERIRLNMKSNSVSKASMNADPSSIRWGFAQIGRLSKDQILQIMASGHHNAAQTYVMAMKFMMARDRALEQLFSDSEIKDHFGGYIARDDYGTRITDVEALNFGKDQELKVYHQDQVVVILPSNGSFVKNGVYILKDGTLHEPNN